jgi:hypothetical protein
VESFNGKLRDAPLNAEAFNTPAEAKVLVEQWRVRHNTVRPHSPLAYQPPAPEVGGPTMPTPPRRSGPTGSHPPAAVVPHQHFARTTQWGLVRFLPCPRLLCCRPMSADDPPRLRPATPEEVADALSFALR